MIGDKPAPAWLTTDFLLGQFARTREQARRQLRAYVEDDTADFEPDVRGVFLGSDQFIHEHTAALTPLAEVPRAHRQPLRPTLDTIFAESGDQVRIAYREWGYTMREIADHLGCHYSTISRRIRQAEQTKPLTRMRDSKT